MSISRDSGVSEDTKLKIRQFDKVVSGVLFGMVLLFLVLMGFLVGSVASAAEPLEKDDDAVCVRTYYASETQVLRDQSDSHQSPGWYWSIASSNCDFLSVSLAGPFVSKENAIQHARLKFYEAFKVRDDLLDSQSQTIQLASDQLEKSNQHLRDVNVALRNSTEIIEECAMRLAIAQ